MSSIYRQLGKEEFKIEKEKPALLPTEQYQESKLTGVKFGIGGAFGLSVLALIGAGLLFQQVNTERRQRQVMEVAQNQIREKAETLEKQTQILGTQTTQYRSEIDRMRDQLKNYASERSEMKSSLIDSQTQLVTIQKKIQEIESRSKVMEDAAQQELQVYGPLAAPTIDSSTTTLLENALKPSGSPAEKAAQVLTVNSKFNFVVLNLGMKDKVKMGDKFTVERSGKKTGSIQVEKIYENFAAATIVEQTNNQSIKEGDEIKKA